MKKLTEIKALAIKLLQDINAEMIGNGEEEIYDQSFFNKVELSVTFEGLKGLFENVDMSEEWDHILDLYFNTK